MATTLFTSQEETYLNRTIKIEIGKNDDDRYVIRLFIKKGTGVWRPAFELDADAWDGTKLYA